MSNKLLLIQKPERTSMRDNLMSIDKIFSDTTLHFPSRTAIICPTFSSTEEHMLTYAELADKSNNLAAILSKKGVSKGSHVVFLLDRSINAIVTILSIIKLGAVYVPIEPTYPASRIQYIIDDANPDLIITQSNYQSMLKLAKRDILLVDSLVESNSNENLPDMKSNVSGDDLAYIIYTSGSTGNPKGVMVPQRGIIRLVKDASYAEFDENRVFLQLATMSFDAATLEIWGPLLNGGTLVLYPESGIPDPQKLGSIITQYKVTTLWLTASLFNSIIDETPDALSGVSEILTGGEALSVDHICKAQKLLPGTQLINGYGPTENTTFTCCYSIPADFNSSNTSIPIGKPINHTTTIIVDEKLIPVSRGEEGELLTGGEGVALGYLNLPELTRKVFIKAPDSIGSGVFYRTGDRVRELNDGNIEFLGRIDSQVKIYGYRIELGEIEAQIKQQALVKEAVVIVHSKGDVKQLIAYLVLNNRNKTTALESIKNTLKKRLPEYMQPVFWVTLDKIPLNANGKLDRRNLPLPENIRPESDNTYITAKNSIQQSLIDIWIELLNIDKVGIDDNVFELGANSIMCLKFVSRAKLSLDLSIPIEKVFQYPAVRSLLESLNTDTKQAKAEEQPITVENSSIAIIGMSGRFPGAENVDQFWSNICDGIESITYMEDDQLDPSIPDEVKNDPSYVKARGILKNIDKFDASFFGISPREAEIMDPQQRVFLELSWEALESAGYAPGSDFDGKVGVFAGMNNNTYFEQNVRTHQDKIAQYGEFNAMIANEKDFLTTRTSFKLNLKGPSVNIFSACSTSLVAANYAADALRKGQCKYALAGGISIIVPQQDGYLYQEGSMLSSDGHCRPFDSKATGTTFNSGAGLVVLKRLEDAIADKDTIYAVIKGIGINNDGSEKSSFTAPSIEGQADAIQSAYSQAGFPVESVSYIETHGTGTPLGDPIEIAGLKQVFSSVSNKSSTISIGSVKSNVGHLVHAAGVTGLIKTALCLKHKVLVPSINFSQLNPRIDFEDIPFVINNKLQPWQSDQFPRRAGVSSFGVGGTNAHIALEEYQSNIEKIDSDVIPQLLILSARSKESLDQAASQMSSYLSSTDQSLMDIAYTLQLGRKSFKHRMALVADSAQAASKSLEQKPANQVFYKQFEGEVPSVVFLFPGQGSQYVNMGRDLYEHYPVFRQAFDACSAILSELCDIDIAEMLLNSSSTDDAEELLKQTQYTQPAIFMVEYSLARLWMDCGIQPEILAGHSIGEFVAACVAGVMTLDDGIKMVVERARLMQSMPSGKMLSVRASASSVESYISDKISLAVVNSPNLCVLSGPEEQIEKTRQKLEAKDFACSILHTSHAFHSSMMDPVIKPFREICQTIKFNKPQIPIISTVTGILLTEEQALDPEYWATHLRNTVRFSEAINTIWQRQSRILLEVGPRTTCTTLAKQHIKDRAKQLAVASLKDKAHSDAEVTAFLMAAGQLWMNGSNLIWSKFHSTKPGRIPLPTYPFERKRYWLDKRTVNENTIIESPLPINPSTFITQNINQTIMSNSDTQDRKIQIISDIKTVLENTSGITFQDGDESLSFLDLGLDSLILTQASLALKNKFKVEITFRQLLESYPGITELSIYLDEVLPDDQYAQIEEQPAQENSVYAANQIPQQTATLNTSNQSGIGVAQQLISQQLQFLSQQLASLNLSEQTSTPVQPAKPLVSPDSSCKEKVLTDINKKPVIDSSSRMARIQKTSCENLNQKQQDSLQKFIKQYNNKTANSKKFAQQHRRQLSDPRTVSGFKPLLKEMIYPIVTDKASGSRLWDIDGNEYVDITCGFGVNYFGWSPDFVTRAVTEQLEKGIEVGPQTPLAGIVAEKICRMTGNERVAFCNTGSEAVLAAIRMARTVSGRNTMVMFAGGYHGIFDEVVVRGSDSLRSFPAAPGIPQAMVENMMVLEYGTDETLEIIRSKAHEIAGILVETVQSRRPELQPVEFLKELRKITEESETALIFDEVVTGFRVHPGGAQAYFDIRADIATYGKVIGGGLPIGVVAGKARYLDVLDGGQWQFGDDSIPEVGVTFFAGTFVRQPLGLAAANAVLDHLEQQGPQLQQSMSDKVEKFVKMINQFFEEQQAGFKLTYFTSFFYLSYSPENTHGGLLFYYLRNLGIHIWEARPCFFTTQHSEQDIKTVELAFKGSIMQMQRDGFLPLPDITAKGISLDSQSPPVEGARLGKNRDGQPAWFVEDSDNPGQYMEIKA